MNKWIRRVAMIAISSAFMIGALAVPSAAAAAADCEIERVCLYINSTRIASYDEPVPSGKCSDTPQHNRMVNYERYWQRMWTKSSCKGNSTLVGPGEDSGPNFGSRYWSVGGY